MRTQINLDDAIGRTIEAVAEHKWDTDFLIAVSGDAFVQVHAITYGDCGADCIDTTTGSRFSRKSYSIESLTTIFGPEAVAAWAAEDEAKKAAEQLRTEEWQRQTYEELKKKFENTP